MKPITLFTVGALLAPTVLALLATHASAQDSSATSAFGATRSLDETNRPASDWIPREHTWASVLYDEPGDGHLWAVGASWKASFGADGVTYFPRVGASEPRNRPLALSPDLVTLGGEPLTIERATQPVRHGDRVALDHGSFAERYDLAVDSVEQSFVFESLPRAGELVLRIPVGSELDAVESSIGLEFRSERGRITYSRAVAIDARGRRTEATTRIEDGAITIRVGADVLADAALPLVIDPVLNAIFPDSTTSDTFEIDAAYDAFNAVWVVAYEQVFSATDHDVYAKMYGSTGSLLATASIDVTTNSWVAPRIADHASAHKFLVVAGQTASSGGAKTVRGRIAQPNGTLLTTDPSVSISGSLSGVCLAPDVGGDSNAASPGSWCVVFERQATASDRTIVYCLVSSAGTIAVGPNTVPFVAGTPDEHPTISKANGGTAWTIAWERSISFPLSSTIMGARISAGGALLAAPFVIGGGTFAGPACASSPISGTERTAVVYQLGIPGVLNTTTTMVALLDGGTVLQLANVKTLENSATAAEDHIQPSVDSDGEHFLVSYSEFDSTFAHYKLFVTDLAVSGNTLQVVQAHLEPQPGLGLSQLRSNVAAARASGTLAHRYLAVYDITQNSADHDVAGRFIEGVLGGPTVPACFGDGSSGPCPCGNTGGAQRGCANSVFAAGAVISLSSGQASTLVDTAVLLLAGVPPGAGCVFFQGDAVGAPIFLGDGLFCTGGSVQRVGTRVANPLGIVTHPQPGDPTLSVRGGVPLAGGTRIYQATYRNAANFCTSATFNVSSGLIVHWAR